MGRDIIVSGAAEGERSSPGAALEMTPWSANRKKEVVLRLMRGEPIDALSREFGVEIYRLEEWHQKALRGIETALKAREGDPLAAELDGAERVCEAFGVPRSSFYGRKVRMTLHMPLPVVRHLD
jgi:transposase